MGGGGGEKGGGFLHPTTGQVPSPHALWSRSGGHHKRTHALPRSRLVVARVATFLIRTRRRTTGKYQQTLESNALGSNKNAGGRGGQQRRAFARGKVFVLCQCFTMLVYLEANSLANAIFPFLHLILEIAQCLPCGIENHVQR